MCGQAMRLRSKIMCELSGDIITNTVQILLLGNQSFYKS